MRSYKSSRSAPLFPGGQPGLTGLTQSAVLSASRLSLQIEPAVEFKAEMMAEDAFILLYQLRDHASHEFWIEGRRTCTPAAPRGSLNIFNLSGEPRALLTSPVDTLFLHIPRAALDDIAEEARSPRLDHLAAPDPWTTFDPIIEQMQPLLLDAIANPDQANTLLHDHLMLALGAHIAHRYGGMRPIVELPRGGLAPWQERRAKELIDASLSTGVSLRDIAEECRLSPAHFSRAFKATVGLSPTAWMQSRRTERAKALLEKAELPTAEIAQMCGFADQSHFTRVFSQYAGCTPVVWRRSRI
ncbi:MAG: AraC family transcriptional regulator [Rhizobium sp.]|nr:MAG: AraC family transcriptional regulator [Rhizobium sp.]